MFIPQLSVTEAQFHDLLVSIPSSLSVSSNHEYKWACEGCTFLNTYKNSVCDYPRNAIVVVFSSPDWSRKQQPGLLSLSFLCGGVASAMPCLTTSWWLNEATCLITNVINLVILFVYIHLMATRER